jgi:hypothetical protein
MGVRPAGDAGGIGNTNAVSSGRYMREDRVGAQANSSSSRAIRWMIRTTMLGVEGKLPAVENRSTLSCVGTISSTPVRPGSGCSVAQKLGRHETGKPYSNSHLTAPDRA